LSLTLIPRYGTMGAGIAAAIGLILSNCVGLFFLNRLVGVWPYDLDHLKPIAAGVVAAGATFLIKSALPLPMGILSMLVVTPIFLVCFAALLPVFGLNESDRQLLAASWKAFLRMIRRDARTASGREPE
jgi:O-antigen/teichoic acid export membrane protein